MQRVSEEVRRRRDDPKRGGEAGGRGGVRQIAASSRAAPSASLIVNDAEDNKAVSEVIESEAVDGDGYRNGEVDEGYAASGGGSGRRQRKRTQRGAAFWREQDAPVADDWSVDEDESSEAVEQSVKRRAWTPVELSPSDAVQDAAATATSAHGQVYIGGRDAWASLETPPPPEIEGESAEKEDSNLVADVLATLASLANVHGVAEVDMDSSTNSSASSHQSVDSPSRDAFVNDSGKATSDEDDDGSSYDERHDARFRPYLDEAAATDDNEESDDIAQTLPRSRNLKRGSYHKSSSARWTQSWTQSATSGGSRPRSVYRGRLITF